MSVAPELVEHIARLARVSLTDDERDHFSRQLGDVLDYVESIRGLDVAGVDPMSHASEGAVLREDEPGPVLRREVGLAAAPDAADGLFRVPRILGG